MNWKIMAGVAAVVASAGLLLSACTKAGGPDVGDPAATRGVTEGDWKHVTRLSDYSIDMHCAGTTGIYMVSARPPSISVLGNDPACVKGGK